ncbi:retrovirus-related pol polyprotein from transposon TNT 1-94 [Tanacetum coccineum]
MGRTSPGTINTWNELKQAFIRRFGPPSVTIKRLGEIHNFRQEEGESLYHAWERYNDLLFKCPSHDLKDYQKVNTFYNGLGFHTRRSLDSRGLILGLTAAKALESIQEMADHSYKWYNEEDDRRITNNGFNSLSMITNKLKNLDCDLNDLRENVHKIHQKSNKGFYHEEVKTIKTSESKQDNQGITLKNKPSRNLKETFERYLEESCKRQDILDEWMKQFIEITNKNLKRHNSVIKNLEEKVVRLAHALAVRKVKRDTSIKSGIPTPDSSNPVKQDCVMKLEPPRETPIQKVETFTEKVKKRIIEEQENKEKLLKKLKRLGNLKPINMVIEMADRSIQSPKGIADNVLTYAYCPCYDRRFGGKISLEVGTEKIVFNANEGATASIVSPVCVINGYQEIDDFERPEGLKEILMNDDKNKDLGNFLKDNVLLPDLRRIDDFIEGIDDLWKDLDPGTFTNDVFDPPLKHELFSMGYRVYRHNPYNLQITCKIENVDEFVGKRHTEVLYEKPFKDHIGLEEDIKREYSGLRSEMIRLSLTCLMWKENSKIKEFYRGCLDLGDEYKEDQEVIDWIKWGHASSNSKEKGFEVTSTRNHVLNDHPENETLRLARVERIQALEQETQELDVERMHIEDSQDYSQTSKAYIVLNKETMRIEESLNVTFDESLPEPKSSPSIEDNRIDEPIVQDLNGSSSLQVNVSDESYPKSLKEARDHPIKQVIGELNERTLRFKTKQA